MLGFRRGLAGLALSTVVLAASAVRAEAPTFLAEVDRNQVAPGAVQPSESLFQGIDAGALGHQRVEVDIGSDLDALSCDDEHRLLACTLGSAKSDVAEGAIAFTGARIIFLYSVG